MRWFHAPAAALMVATPDVERRLAARGFTNLARWSRGVDTELFRPGPHASLDVPRPIFLYAGRVAVEKNIEAFLALDLPGTKWVVGDGPARPELQRRFPDAVVLRHEDRRGRSRGTTARPTCSSSRAAPTRSAS